MSGGPVSCASSSGVRGDCCCLMPVLFLESSTECWLTVFPSSIRDKFDILGSLGNFFFRVIRVDSSVFSFDFWSLWRLFLRLAPEILNVNGMFSWDIYVGGRRARLQGDRVGAGSVECLLWYCYGGYMLVFQNSSGRWWSSVSHVNACFSLNEPVLWSFYP